MLLAKSADSVVDTVRKRFVARVSIEVTPATAVGKIKGEPPLRKHRQERHVLRLPHVKGRSQLCPRLFKNGGSTRHENEVAHDMRILLPAIRRGVPLIPEGADLTIHTAVVRLRF